MNVKECILAVLRGDFSSDTVFSRLSPKSKLVIFVSSTFTDTHLERNILMEQILPELQSKARTLSVAVTFVDMRSGLKDEDSKEHMTWTSCRDQIRYCYEESDGLFFLSLQGNKYGYMPLPKFIDQQSFDHIKERDCWDDELIDLAERWYHLDMNHVPPRYSLVRLHDYSDPLFWKIALPRLREALEGLQFDSNVTSELNVYRSITEWEARYAFELDCSRCLWFRRDFSDIKRGEDLMMEYNDHNTIETAKINDKYLELISYMERKVHPKTFSDIAYCDYLRAALSRKKCSKLVQNSRKLLQHFAVDEARNFVEEVEGFLTSIISYDSRNEQYENYMKAWINSMIEKLNSELDCVLNKVLSWNKDGNGVGLPGCHISEMLHHYKLAAEKCNHFYGRSSLIENALCILQRETETETSTATINVSLGIVGVSGAGKTAFMSKLAQVSRNSYPDIPVIIRFAGTSKGSVDGLVLISSICLQIQLIYAIPFQQVSSVYSDAVQYFHYLLLTYPVILFIDSIDQLSDMYLARSRLSFLIGVNCHKHTRIIVSSLPDERDEESGIWKYCYMCHTRLLEASVPLLYITGFQGVLGGEEAKGVLSEMLLARDRCLTDRQWTFVLDQVVFEPTALYLSLSVNVITKWQSNWLVLSNSTEPSMCSLVGTVQGIINQILDRLEIEFGPILVRYALGFITFAQAGVSDNEIQDLLSLVDEVIDEVFQYSKPENFTRISLHVWLRLRGSMQGLIVERTFNCWSWFHRQLKETCIQRYDADEKCKIHKILGIYFSNIVPELSMKNRMTTPQPLTLSSTTVWFEGAKINERRCIEGSYHLVEAGLLEEATNELCSFEVVVSCTTIGYGFYLVANMSRLLTKLKLSKSFSLEKLLIKLEHFYRWLYQDMSLIVNEPMSAITSTASAQPKCSLVRQAMEELLLFTCPRNCIFPSLSKRNYWTRGLLLGGMAGFSPVLSSLSHPSFVLSVCISKEGAFIVSGSSDGIIRIWDTLRGACTSLLEGHSGGVEAVAMTEDGSTIFSGSCDSLVKKWDFVSGACVSTFVGHSAPVLSISMSVERFLLASGSKDHSIKIWDPYLSVCLQSLRGHINTVNSVWFSRCGTKLASGSDDTSIKFWDVMNGTCLASMFGHGAAVRSVCMDKDMQFLVSGSADTTIKIWQLAKGLFECCNTLVGHKGWVSSVCISNDGTTIISGSFSKVVNVDDEGVRRLHTAQQNISIEAEWTEASWDAIKSTSDKDLKVWDFESGVCVNTLTGHSSAITAVCLSIDGTKAVSASGDKTVKLWEVSMGESTVLEGHTGAVPCCALNADGSIAISASNDYSIMIWDTVARRCVKQLQGHTDMVFCVAFSPDYSFIASGSMDNSVRLWLVESGECIRSFIGHTDRIWSLCFSPADGACIISSSFDKSIKVWDVLSGEILQEFTGHTGWIRAVVVTSDGNKILSAGDDCTIRVFDARCSYASEDEDMASMILLGHTDGIKSLSLSSDMTKIASGSNDKSIKIWGYCGTCFSTLTGHTDQVLSVCWSQDCSILVSGSCDNTLRIWDVKSGLCTAHLFGHTDYIRSINLSLDGSKIVSGSDDKSVRIWEVFCLC